MPVYRGSYENYEIEIDGLVMFVVMPKFNMERLYEFNNEKSLSAMLRDTVGYGPAKDLLEGWGVPHDSELWDLNHSNPWR